MEIPIYFNYGLDHHGNFPKIFEELRPFGDNKISILHLGAYTGHGTKWMLERVNAGCIDVDTWQGSKRSEGHLDFKHDIFYTDEVENLYDETVSGFPAIKFKGTTADFFKQNKETFDFIYVDASHKKTDVALDLEESWKVLNDGGIIACDDYLWEMHEGPEHIPHYAIKEFVEQNKEKIEILIDNYQLWFKKV
jgi:predicted O-methyltransferase YrrM